MAVRFFKGGSLVLAVLVLILARCSARGPVAGTSSGVEAKVAQGVVTHANGSGAANTRVWLIPAGYNPVKEGPVPDSLSVMTDDDGRYSLHTKDTGMFNIIALCNCDLTRVLVSNIQFLEDSIYVPSCVLQEPGALIVSLPDSADAVTGYVYLSGTGIYAGVNRHDSTVILDSVPPGTLPAICYVSTGHSLGQVIRYNVEVPPADTVVIYNPVWMFSKMLVLNTSATGANVSGNVFHFPVLVRLLSSNFNFSEAKKNGDDVRFTKPDNTPLAYEIEEWDSAGGAAAIWVKVDTVLGNNSTQYIVMYWGNPEAASISNGPQVFDTANGFVGVWHLSEAGNATAEDATGNHFDGTPENMTAASSVPGAIGIGRQFNGQSSYIVMANTASGKLNFPENGTYSVSAWVYADSLNDKYHLIASKGDLQYNLEIKNTNEWEFTEFEDMAGWDESTSLGSARAWTYVVGVRDGALQYLYVNGVCVDNTIYLNADTGARDTTNNFMIGKRVNFNSYYFSGIIDEVRVSSVDPGPDWIKLCFVNQSADDQFVIMK
jgi:hypothetical protein